jgi:hypothetical protein
MATKMPYIGPRLSQPLVLGPRQRVLEGLWPAVRFTQHDRCERKP